MSSIQAGEWRGAECNFPEAVATPWLYKVLLREFYNCSRFLWACLPLHFPGTDSIRGIIHQIRSPQHPSSSPITSFPTTLLPCGAFMPFLLCRRNAFCSPCNSPVEILLILPSTVQSLSILKPPHPQNHFSSGFFFFFAPVTLNISSHPWAWF